MEYMLNDVPFSDPFLSLQPDLDLNDVHEVIRQQGQQDGQQEWAGGIEDRLFNALPHEDRSMEIGSIVSMLQEEQPAFNPAQPMDVNPGVGVGEWRAGPSQDVFSPNTNFPGPSSASTFFPQQPHPSLPSPSVRPDRWKEDVLKQLDKMPAEEIKSLLESRPAQRSQVLTRQLGQKPTVGVATVLSSEGRVIGEASGSGGLRAAAVVKQESPSSPLFTPTPSTRSQLSPASAGGDESDGETEDSSSSKPFKHQHKPERRTAHNLIEKKYRCSINDKINDLKEMLCGPEAKVSKSGILKKAIDHILFLRDQNSKLKERNEKLQQALVGVQGAAKQSPSGPPCIALSPASDSGESEVSSAQSSSSSTSRTPRPMMDRSKVSMFVFMLCLVVMNPFSMGGGEVGPAEPIKSVAGVPGGRVLHAFDPQENESWWQDKIFRVMCLWLLNGLVIACVLARVLIYGEPVTDSASATWTSFRSFLHQAESEFAKGNLCLGAQQLGQCLSVLGRPLPSSPLDEWASLLWQFFRHLLNWAWIGKWLSKQRRGTIKPTSVMRSHGEAALVYHRLHQLHLMGQVEGGSVLGASLALSAVNLAEAAGSTLAPSHLVEVYLLAALRARQLPRPFRLVEKYLMSRARSAAKQKDVELEWNVRWMLSPLGRRFLKKLAPTSLIGLRPSNYFPFCTVTDSASLFDHLTALYKMHLLQSLVEVFTGGKQLGYVGRNAEKTLNGCRVSEILAWTRALYDCCGPLKAPEFPKTVKIVQSEDELCVWWTNIFTCVVYWYSGEKKEAQFLYQKIRGLPRDLLADPLSLAMGHAFCARKVCSENKTQKQYEQLVWLHCCKSHSSLRDYKGCGKLPALSKDLTTLVESLVLDWLLRCLADLWRERLPGERGYWTHKASPTLLTRFHRLLHDYRQAAPPSDASHFKALVHETTFRMLSGANPLATWQQLQRCVRQCRETSAVTDSDRTRLHGLLQLHGNF